MNTDQIIVVDAHENYVMLLKELVTEYVNIWYEVNEMWSEADVELVESLPSVHIPPVGASLLAFVNNFPAGCVLLKPSNESTVEMVKLFVKPEFRRMGVAELLIQEVIKRSQSMGKVLELEVYEQKLPAIKLYKKMGFVTQPSRIPKFIVMQYPFVN